MDYEKLYKDDLERARMINNGKVKRWTEHYHLDCIHEEWLVNHGIRMCKYGDVSNCEECPFREPIDYDCECASTSTVDLNPGYIDDAS